jgi:hypothetical protein
MSPFGQTLALATFLGWTGHGDPIQARKKILYNWAARFHKIDAALYIYKNEIYTFLIRKMTFSIICLNSQFFTFLFKNKLLNNSITVLASFCLSHDQ